MTFSSISDLWNQWNIRGIVILSLSLQVFLILCAPLRRKISNPYIIFPLWLAYLTADWVAAFGIGLVSHGQGNFLIFQVNVAIYVFVQIFPGDTSLVIPTMLVFLAGAIKNAERTFALYLSSFPRLRTSMHFPDKLRKDARSKLNDELNKLEWEHSNEEKTKLTESTMVKHAYLFFNIFKAFLSDLFYFSEERQISFKYFHKVCALDALRVISVELHFMYEVLHTKVLAIRSKWSYIFRFIAFTEVMMAFVFFNRFKKHQLPELDVVITYILLFEGIALDMTTLSILVFSDWTVAKIMSYKTGRSKFDSFLHKLISATDDRRKPRFATCNAELNANSTYVALDTPFVFRRWSESISACNIFSESLEKSPRKMYKHNQCWGIIAFSNICSLPFLVTEKIISLFHQTRKICIGRTSFIFVTTPRYTSKNPFINELWIFIFEEVRRKSKYVSNPTDARKIYEARGDMFLQGRLRGINCENLLEHVTKASYDSSVLIWHTATEIWYNKEKHKERNDKREFSKILSDYLLYLLLKQPNVMSIVAGFAQLTSVNMIFAIERIKGHAKDVEGLCETLYDHPLELLELRSPLRQGIALAQKMQSLDDKKWEVMSGVWVEMLSYAASHIKGEAHAQVLSKGGELLAFVWLLLAHFGCLYKPEWGTYEDDMFEMELKGERDDDNGDQEEDVSTVVTAERDDDNGDQEEDVSTVETASNRC
ncbi:hypothetical protein ACJRO7_000161 [Eucalyptus globulus]|uniref:DUF4220 domain-containing protein n=1 Tax=Eucalyptus globulus TaxID=34317 RepID=A0ABD3LMN3_EUCGL